MQQPELLKVGIHVEEIELVKAVSNTENQSITASRTPDPPRIHFNRIVFTVARRCAEEIDIARLFAKDSKLPV
jgi:hypothetical protein